MGEIAQKCKLAEIHSAIHELDPKLNQHSAEFRAIVVLLAGSFYGNRSAQIARFTNYPIWFIRHCARNLRKNGIWRHDVTYANWNDEQHGGVSLILDSLVALGKVRFEPDKVATSA